MAPCWLLGAEEFDSPHRTDRNPHYAHAYSAKPRRSVCGVAQCTTATLETAHVRVGSGT